MSAVYFLGYAVIIFALALAAYYLHVPTRWITVGIILLVGMGLTGYANSRRGRP